MQAVIIIGKSAGIKRVLELIDKVKDSTLSVMITGESGTGKELVARAIHGSGVRSKEPFVAINCASLKPELLENELFGHVKGAFTGATNSKLGLVRVAGRGTLFIDEIADMNLVVQASLLRFVESGVFRPLGSSTEEEVGVRVVAAMNRDIEKEVSEKRFRLDLYYRLNVCRIEVPPLRTRLEDLPELVNYFFETEKSGRGGLTTSALEALKEHSWPGNVRELFNVLESATLLNNNSLIGREEVWSLIKKSPLLPVIKDKEKKNGASLSEMEARHIVQTLSSFDWNISQTAKNLQIDRRTLQRKISRYGIEKNMKFL